MTPATEPQADFARRGPVVTTEKLDGDGYLNQPQELDGYGPWEAEAIWPAK